jgi:hypothetical protein
MIAGWLLLSQIRIVIDTRVPEAGIQWVSIGTARIWYDQEWWLGIRVLFFRKTIRLAALQSKPKQVKEHSGKKKPGVGTKPRRMWKKLIRTLKTFRINEWQLALDTGDYTQNARLYPLNFLPFTMEHLSVNFKDENYLVVKISNRPWRMIVAYLQ